ARLRESGEERAFTEDLRGLEADLGARYRLVLAWLGAWMEAHLAAHPEAATLRPALEEAAVLLLTDGRIDRSASSVPTAARVEGLLGQHRRIEQRSLELRLDDFLARLEGFRRHRVPGFRDYQAKRHQVLERERERLRVAEFQPRVMSSFVRNQLIDQVYLPLIGANLAKQLGAVGEGKRTDLMGMLLLISPPGYGKTTLMEYVANRLGLVFMKVNGPALGHAVRSLDPAEAPNATARQEVEKINLGLEMGNNVLLYLDDIQHTDSELLQKFISLCDAQRKIEGVWRGRTRTYDLRGKRFCICMAGNPYTESGERFQIPDMLANRADTFNLGDILAGKEDLFALSYIENALTSNTTLAPLAAREPEDVHKLVRLARGEEVPADQLAHPYSALEISEITAVLRHLLRVQQVLLKVNQQYILSASQDDAYRTEPRFQLQGSYRNMNKLAEKVVPVMNEQELEILIDDHYAGEAQTLTTGAEHNLLKLAELRGRMTPRQVERWAEIKRGFTRVQLLGASDGDPVSRVTGQLSLVSERMGDIARHIEAAAKDDRGDRNGPNDGLAVALTPFVEALHGNLQALSQTETK
ncbi:MAG TPA: AAA family ATPase, partial [Candidatus Nanopelagicales bacterium]|nr:AAA family ATPase [Candidatus Nanopelagicales bacterium]